MNEYAYDGSLEGLFALLDRARQAVDPAAALPDRVRAPKRRGWESRSGGTAPPAAFQPDLFAESPGGTGAEPLPIGAPFLAAASAAIMTGTVPAIAAARQLHELSADAYDCVVHGWMSELPVEAELLRFAGKVLDAGLGAPGGLSSPAAREAAEAAAADRGDPDVATALAAARKVWKELDRLRGLLRFSPGRGGAYLARCAPDHFVLPGLAGHFRTRFGETPWAIIDERRGLALARGPGAAPRLVPLEEEPRSIAAPDPWEDLWRSYHKVIANETRSNPKLQQQFMPRRYWKYLPEKNNRQ